VAWTKYRRSTKSGSSRLADRSSRAGTPILSVPVVRNRRRQLLKKTEPPPDVKARGSIVLVRPAEVRLHRMRRRQVRGCCLINCILSQVNPLA